MKIVDTNEVYILGYVSILTIFKKLNIKIDLSFR
jgi:hypothetical protein